MADDTPQFTQKTQKIASERAIMDMTGLSRTQLRRGIRSLGAFANRMLESRAVRPTPAPPPDPITRRSDSIIQGGGLGGAGTPAQATPGQQKSLPSFTALVVDAGVGKEALVYGSLGDPLP